MVTCVLCGRYLRWHVAYVVRNSHLTREVGMIRFLDKILWGSARWSTFPEGSLFPPVGFLLLGGPTQGCVWWVLRWIVPDIFYFFLVFSKKVGPKLHSLTCIHIAIYTPRVLLWWVYPIQRLTESFFGQILASTVPLFFFAPSQSFAVLQ